MIIGGFGMNELINENDKVESLIYEIRGKQVMLDSDLARLYECKNGTKTINQAVSRHKDRFPEDFVFNLSQEEFVKICGPNLGPQIRIICQEFARMYLLNKVLQCWLLFLEQK